MTPISTRRGIVRLAGAATLGGLAGCSRENGGENDEEESDANGGAGENGREDGNGTGEGNAQEQGDGEGEEEGDGQGDENGETEAGEENASTVTAVASGEATEEGEFYFDPPMATVDTGETVRWEIEAEQHTVTAFHPDNQVPNRIPESADPFDSDTLAETDTFERQFEEEGVYDYFCRPHESEGMVGTVVVGEPDPADQPGLAEPQGDGEISEPAVEELTVLNGRAESYLEEL